MQNFRDNKKIFIFVGVILLLVGTYTGLVLKRKWDRDMMNNPAMNALATSGEGTPYTDMNGNVLTFDSYLGEILVVNSWASWAPDSAKELPTLAKVASEFSDKNVKVIAINRAEPQTTAERFLQTVGAADGVELVLDLDDRYYKSVSGFAMPETIFYDREGNIVHHHHGVISEEDLRNYLQKTFEVNPEN